MDKPFSLIGLISFDFFGTLFGMSIAFTSGTVGSSRNPERGGAAGHRECEDRESFGTPHGGDGPIGEDLFPIQVPVLVRYQRHSPDGKSLLNLLGLGAIYGWELTLVCEGEGAKDAHGRLRELLLNKFGERE